MFYSPRGHIGFVHYPKTAGTSLQHWFRRVFPDGDLLDPENPHLTVASSLAAVQERRKRAGRGWRKWVPALLGGYPKREAVPRIVGVIRDPLEMLVSLYEYWRRHDFAVEPTAAFIRCARQDSFHAFVRMAVVDGQAPTYEWFFDVGGPAWPSTRLINYHALERGLEELCGEFGIDRPPYLEKRNATSGTRDLDAYRREAGSLIDDVERHFRWYYEYGRAVALGSGWSRAA